MEQHALRHPEAVISRTKRVLAAAATACLLSASILTVPAPSSAEGRAVGFRCVIDAIKRTPDGRIRMRQVVNDRLRRDMVSHQRFGWTPLSWGLVSSSSWPGHATVQYLVPASDGNLRLVETVWQRGRGLDVRVVRLVGRSGPRELVTTIGNTVYWVTADGSIRWSRWTGRRLTGPAQLPDKVPGATAITGIAIDRLRLYVTDRSGALHAVEGGSPHRVSVVASRGFAHVRAIKVGACHTPRYDRIHDFVGLVTVDRRTGNARFRRHLRPGSAAGQGLGNAVPVRPTDGSWRGIG